MSSLLGLIHIIIFILITFSLLLNAYTITRPLDIAAQSNNNIATSANTNTRTSSSLTDKVPSFLEAYWTDNTSTATSSTSTNSNQLKKEVGPGEGDSVLAIVLVNRGRSEITGVTGYLTLPFAGFRSIEGENNVTSPNIAVASHDLIVQPGESFIMYFTVNVLPEARVGAYSSGLNLVYSKVNEIGQISTSMAIPFRITGKVILDVALLEQNLTAGSANPLPILLSNKGTANASGVVATINAIDSGTTTTTTATSTTIPASTSSSPLAAPVADNNTITNTTVNAQSTESTTVDTSTTTSPSEVEQEESSAATLVDSRTFDIGIIPAKSSVIITPVVYPDYSADGTIQNLDLEITYNDAYGVRTSSGYSMGMIVSPNPPESVLSISPYIGTEVSGTTTITTAKTSSDSDISATDRMNSSIMLIAGKIENVNFTITNNGKLSLSDVILSLNSGSDSVKLLGDPRWRFERMTPASEYILSVPIYAATGVINTPVGFTLDAEYIEGGQSKTDTLSIGAYVDGQIKVRVYDLAINYVGGAPTLVGNLLNEGNTVALFTTIDLANSTTAPNEQDSVSSFLASQPQQQYLGDLTENSPLPFSIPLDINRNAPAGTFPVNLGVTYSDNLRNVHNLILEETVEYEPIPSQSSSNSGSQSLNFLNLLPVAVIVIAAVTVSIFLIRRRRKRKNAFSRRSTDNLEDEGIDLFLSDRIHSDHKK